MSMLKLQFIVIMRTVGWTFNGFVGCLVGPSIPYCVFAHMCSCQCICLYGLCVTRFMCVVVCSCACLFMCQFCSDAVRVVCVVLCVCSLGASVAIGLCASVLVCELLLGHWAKSPGQGHHALSIRTRCEVFLSPLLRLPKARQMGMVSAMASGRHALNLCFENKAWPLGLEPCPPTKTVTSSRFCHGLACRSKSKTACFKEKSAGAAAVAAMEAAFFVDVACWLDVSERPQGPDGAIPRHRGRPCARPKATTALSIKLAGRVAVMIWATSCSAGAERVHDKSDKSADQITQGLTIFEPQKVKWISTHSPKGISVGRQNAQAARTSKLSLLKASLNGPCPSSTQSFHAIEGPGFFVCLQAFRTPTLRRHRTPARKGRPSGPALRWAPVAQPQSHWTTLSSFLEKPCKTTEANRNPWAAQNITNFRGSEVVPLKKSARHSRSRKWRKATFRSQVPTVGGAKAPARAVPAIQQPRMRRAPRWAGPRKWSWYVVRRICYSALLLAKLFHEEKSSLLIRPADCTGHHKSHLKRDVSLVEGTRTCAATSRSGVAAGVMVHTATLQQAACSTNIAVAISRALWTRDAKSACAPACSRFEGTPMRSRRRTRPSNWVSDRIMALKSSTTLRRRGQRCWSRRLTEQAQVEGKLVLWIL